MFIFIKLLDAPRFSVPFHHLKRNWSTFEALYSIYRLNFFFRQMEHQSAWNLLTDIRLVIKMQKSIGFPAYNLPYFVFLVRFAPAIFATCFYIIREIFGQKSVFLVLRWRYLSWPWKIKSTFSDIFMHMIKVSGVGFAYTSSRKIFGQLHLSVKKRHLLESKMHCPYYFENISIIYISIHGCYSW